MAASAAGARPARASVAVGAAKVARLRGRAVSRAAPRTGAARSSGVAEGAPDAAGSSAGYGRFWPREGNGGGKRCGGSLPSEMEVVAAAGRARSAASSSDTCTAGRDGHATTATAASCVCDHCDGGLRAARGAWRGALRIVVARRRRAGCSAPNSSARTLSGPMELHRPKRAAACVGSYGNAPVPKSQTEQRPWPRPPPALPSMPRMPPLALPSANNSRPCESQRKPPRAARAQCSARASERWAFVRTAVVGDAEVPASAFRRASSRSCSCHTAEDGPRPSALGKLP